MEEGNRKITGIGLVFVLVAACVAVFVYRIFFVTYDYRISHKFHKYIDEYLSDNQFSGEILLAKDGQIYYSKMLANYDEESSKRHVSSEPSMPIASLTKTITGAAILQLQAEGKLSVEDTLSKYYPDFKQVANVTIKDLLEMKSGIKDLVTEQLRLEKTINKDTIVYQILKQSLERNPGEEYSYNNSDYFILGNIIEQIAKKSYYEYVQDAFFTPLGMRDMGIVSKEQLAVFADGKDHTEYDYDATYAAGGLSASVVDLYKWQRALYSGEFDFDITKMFETAEYSCGLTKKDNTYYHKGELKYCTSFMYNDIDEDIQVIVLCNNDTCDANEVAMQAMVYFYEYLEKENGL